MNRYEEMETFVRVVEAGSITAAAGQLGVAKSAVSRRLSELEQRLGTQLMQRTTRQLTLTDTGEALYERAVGLLADWAEAEGSASGAQAALAGRMRIAAPLSFGLAHLGPALLDFTDQHPQIELDIDFSDRRVDLVSEGVDLGIRIGELEDSSLIARKIAPIETVAAASPAYLAQHGTPNVPDDLRTHRELRYRYRNEARWRWTGPDGATGEVEMEPALTATNGEFLREAALAGKGIVIVPTFILHEELRAGRLTCLLRDYNWQTLNAYAVYPPTRHLSRRVRALVDFLVQRFGSCPIWDQW